MTIITFIFPYLVFGLALFAVLLLVRRYELNRIRLKNQLKLEKIETDSLRSMGQVKSRFFANISHEFRTPLTMILAQVESLLPSGTNNLEKEKLRAIDRNARKLLLLINQILDLSKLDAGKLELSLSQQDIVSFVKGLLFSFESLAGGKNISLAFKSAPDNIQLVFDPDKMEHIFCNLLTNAIKYTDEGGQITIAIQADHNSYVRVRVENDGHGIPTEQLPHIFDRYYQVDGSGSSFQEGTGIGLALTKELVELHRGSISVESVQGEKTVFSITFPTDKLTPGNVSVIEQGPVNLYSSLINNDKRVD